MTGAEVDAQVLVCIVEDVAAKDDPAGITIVQVTDWIPFVDGTGTDQPEGFLRSPTSTAEDGVRPFKTVQYIGSGDANGFDSAPEI